MVGNGEAGIGEGPASDPGRSTHDTALGSAGDAGDATACVGDIGLEADEDDTTGGAQPATAAISPVVTKVTPARRRNAMLHGRWWVQTRCTASLPTSGAERG